jgi:hypothetical protein
MNKTSQTNQADYQSRFVRRQSFQRDPFHAPQIELAGPEDR